MSTTDASLPPEKVAEIGFAVLRAHNDSRLWRALTYDSGPYDLTTPTLALQDLGNAFYQAGKRAALAQQAPAVTDVRRILLDVVPGPDGMGNEVFAQSVDDVERKLTELGEKAEELASIKAAQQAPAAEPVAWLRDQRGEYEGRETLDPLFVLGSWEPKNFRHGATYSPLYAAPQPPQAQPLDHVAAALAKAHAAPAVKWPTERAVGRAEDMGEGYLRIVLDSDNDVCVAVWDGKRSAGVEFCNPGGGGGGRSSRTRMALIALMVAMEADNAERPDLQRPARA